MESEKRASKKRRNKYDELLFALTQLSPFEIVWGKFVAKDEDGRKHILKDVRGYCDFEHQRIYLNHNMNKTESIEVLTHELLHSLLPSFFSDKHNSEQLDLKTLDEADEEVLVESATYYICSKYGIDTFENFYNYISDWTKNKSTEEQEKLFAGAKYVAREFTKLLDNELVHVRNCLYEEAVTSSPQLIEGHLDVGWQLSPQVSQHSPDDPDHHLGLKGCHAPLSPRVMPQEHRAL